MKRSLIPMAVVLLIVSLSLDGSPAFGGDRGHGRGGYGGGGRGHGGGGRVSSGFSGGRHFGSMPARGGQMFTRSGMGIRGGHNWNRGTWSGQRWSGRNWSGRNWNGRNWNNWNGRNWSGRNWNGGTWSGRNWNGSLTNWNGGWGWWNGGRWWFPTSNVVFIGGFGFPWWWGWGWGPWSWGPWSWGWSGYPSGFYGYGSQYGYYGQYGYGNPGYGYGNGYGSGYGNAGQHSSATRSRVAELQQRLTRAGYYSGPIDGALGPQTQQAIRAYMEDHGYTSSSASPNASPNQANGP